MKILDQFIQSKAPNQDLCEDEIFISDDFVAIIDGATSKSTTLWDGKTSGKMAALILKKEMNELPTEIRADKAFFTLNSAIENWYKDQNQFEEMQKNSIERATASMIIYSRHHQQIWILSDCQAMIDDKFITNPKPLDDLFEKLRAFYLEIELLKGKTITDLLQHDTGRDIVVPFIAQQIRLQNSDNVSEFAYDVLDGFFSRTESIKIFDIPEKTHQIVLASDGYPVLKPTLEETEAELATLLKDDPLCFRQFRSTKGLKKGNNSFDDRSYVRISLES